MSFNFPERKPTPPGSPRIPDAKPVSGKEPRTKPAQLKKHQATRSLDIKNLKAQREKAWTPGTVEKSSGTGIPVLIDGFVNWLKKEEGGPQLGVKLFQELEKKLKTNKPIIAKINNFTSEEIETALGNMQQIPLMELGAALPLYHRCIGWLDSRQEALETPKHELPKLSSGGLSEPSREPSIETKVTTPRVSEKREAIEASIKASEATKKLSPDEKARQKSEPEVVSAFTTALVSAARKGDADQIDEAERSLETYFYDRVARGGNPLEVTKFNSNKCLRSS